MAELKEQTAEEAVRAAQTGNSRPGGGSLTDAAIKKKKRAKRRKVRRTIITLIIIAAVIGGIVYGMFRLFREEEVESIAQTAQIFRGSIQSRVSGTGQAMPKESETITLTSGGTVLEVFVKEGDMVQEGDPLYIIDSTAAEQAVDDAQKTVNNIQKQIDAITKTYKDLIVRAEYGGKLVGVNKKLRVGDEIPKGTPVATLVDDSRMKLELYFSYAYEKEITAGQAATVSIPSAMNELYGVVSEIHYIQYVSPEGAQLFRVVIEVDNPGSLAPEMGASAWLRGSSGLEVYPYEGGKLEYSRSVDIETKAGGTALFVELMDDLKVSEGQLLLEMNEESNDEAVAALENQLRTASDTLERAQSSLEKFNGFAPMSGTVLSCALKAGTEIESGQVAVTIANTVTMSISARIDEMNVAYVKPGMTCEITQQSRDVMQSFIGTVESVSLEGKFENGMTYFPAVITVDNFDGSLMSGMYIEYNLVASQSDNCLLAPVQAVKYTAAGVCVFLKADTPPANMLNAEELGIEVPEGFYAVPVTIGISDTSNVEIIEGLEEFAEVFTQFGTMQNGPGGMGGMIRIG